MEQVGDQWVESYKKVISRVREDSGKIDLRRFLLKAGQGNQTSLGDGGEQGTGTNIEGNKILIGSG